MFCLNFVSIVIILLYSLFDINYLFRTLFTVFSGRLSRKKYTLRDNTTIYGICTLQDCDILFRHIRVARIVRELDFARYYFYDVTGIYRRSRHLKIRSLQGCTLTVTFEPIPLFLPYKIDTKLVYWDNRSLFLSHQIITIHDGRVRSLVISRQHALGRDGDSTTEDLLHGLPGSGNKPNCPEHIRKWLESMTISSAKIRGIYGHTRN